MLQRGRKSAARMEVGTGTAVAIVRRPEAPLNLAPAETEEWMAIVDAMPADWFPRESWPLLEGYCRHAVYARRVAQLIDQEMASTDLDPRDLAELMQMHARETASLKAGAASMRLSQQASYSARGAGGEKSRRVVSRPWDDG